MAFSRDDNAKIRCNLNSYNNQLGYMLNVPGNGVHPDYFVDPQIRLQKFGAKFAESTSKIKKEKALHRTLSRCTLINMLRVRLVTQLQ